MDPSEELIGINGAAAVMGRSADDIRRYVEEGRLNAEPDANGNENLRLSEVKELTRALEIEDAEEEVFEGEVVGDDSSDNSRLPAVPFERYERLLQQGQDYKTRLEERNRQMEDIRQERDAARVEMDRLWGEIERLNLIEFQRELQEKTISTLEEEKAKLKADRERLAQEHQKIAEEKSTLAEERTRLEAELKVMKNRGFFSRLFGG
ncbi:MAG: hypothetical protein WA982_00995 [Rubrobacteraceae bacterium]